MLRRLRLPLLLAGALLSLTLLDPALPVGLVPFHGAEPPPAAPARLPTPARAVALSPAAPEASGEPPPLGSAVRIRWLPATVARFDRLLVEAGHRHGVEPELLAIITLVESGGFTGARSPSGALGLMQLMPPTARDVAAALGVGEHDDRRLGEPAYNLDFGAWYLAAQLRAFERPAFADTVDLAAAAYNGGPNGLRRHLDGGGTLSAQTERYRRWVNGMWAERNLDRSARFEEWLQAGGAHLVALAQAEMRAAR